MSSIIDTLFTPNAITAAQTPNTDDSAAYLQNLFAGIVDAVRAMFSQRAESNASRFDRGPARTQGPRTGLPSQFSGRTLPEVAGKLDPTKAARLQGHGALRNGDYDMMRLLTERLFGACPTRGEVPKDPCDGAPPVTPAVCGGATPEDIEDIEECGGEPPVDETTPTDDVEPEDGEPEAPSKVFVVGDLKHFGRGDGTVRSGLEQLLDAATNPKKKGRNKVEMPEEDVARLRALLASNDPEAQATLSTKVPNKKSLVIDESGQLLSTLDTRSQVMANGSLNVAHHKNNQVDRSAGGQLELDGQAYDVVGTELHSPIKIGLDGKDAKLDGKHGFRIDLNGFENKGGEIKTSGGLNGNEAWLVRDREGNGIVKNGVVDGNDVYGDHSGQRKDGYDDLARDFANEVKTDPKTGRRYIDLTAPDSRAARELKLLDGNGKLRPASEVLQRIDVDGVGANERDAKGNVITARGEVTYKDGHTATSADQWFKAVA